MKSLLKTLLIVGAIVGFLTLSNALIEWVGTLPPDLIAFIGGATLFLVAGFFIAVIFAIVALALEAAGGRE